MGGRVTSPTWGPPGRPLGSTRSHRDLEKSHRVLGEICFISPKCLSSRRDPIAISEKLQISPSSWRDLFCLAELSFISARSRQYLARDRFHLVPISETLQISPSSRRDFVNLDEISFTSARSRRDLRDITNLAEISSGLTRSRRDLCHLGEVSSRSLRQYKSRRDLG